MLNKVKIIDISNEYKSDERGWSVSPDFAKLNILSENGNFHIVSMLPEAIRGNHKHLLTDEWIVVWGAKIIFAYGDENSNFERIFASDKAHLVFIPKHIYHALKNIDSKEGFLFSYFMITPVDYEKEIIRKKILV